MRVCISCTYLYSIKSLNHTLPFRICRLCFSANMQVASTLRPSRKAQKISEYRFRLRWTKCSPRTEAKQVKTCQPQRASDKEAQTSPTPSSWGRLAPLAGRPTPLVGAPARGPHRLKLATWQLGIGSQCQFAEDWHLLTCGSLL